MRPDFGYRQCIYVWHYAARRRCKIRVALFQRTGCEDQYLVQLRRLPDWGATAV